MAGDAGAGAAAGPVRIALPPVAPAAMVAMCDPALPVVAIGGATMGTGWTVRLAAPIGLDMAALRRAIVARLDGIVAQMSQWEAGSDLSAFNRAPAGHRQVLPPDFAQVVAAALDVAAESAGAFDPSIGRLVDLWGFGPTPAPQPPDDSALDAALADAGWRRLAFDPAARTLRQPGGLALDLAGIAKGHAVDAVADVVQAAGVAHALVEIGGELAGRGMRPDGDPWWVDLEAPPAAAIAPLRIALHGIAVATSGDYVRGRHTIDPRTGQPADAGVAAVSVIHRSAMLADAWATALTVLGPIAGPAAAARTGIAARFVLREGGGYGERVSPVLAAMMAD